MIFQKSFKIRVKYVLPEQVRIKRHLTMQLGEEQAQSILQGAMRYPAPAFCITPEHCFTCRLNYIVAHSLFEVFLERKEAVVRKYLRTGEKIPVNVYYAIIDSLRALTTILGATTYVQFVMANDQLKVASAKWLQVVDQYEEYLTKLSIPPQINSPMIYAAPAA